MFHSSIYEGSVRHRRNHPKVHQFDFRLFMLMVDLSELDTVFSKRLFWSTRSWTLCRLKREDHLKQHLPLTSLRDRALATLAESEINEPVGRISLLTQLSYLGFSMNPVSFFYCYHATEDRIVAVIAEVNNTPWGEQHVYVIPSSAIGKQSIRSADIKKDFHVSPFMTLDMNYRMAFSPPADRLAVKIENHAIKHDENDASPQCDASSGMAVSTESDSEVKKWIDVTLSMKQRKLTGPALAWLLIKYPAISFQVFLGIYWQALRLYLKKIPFVSHPNRVKTSESPTVPPESDCDTNVQANVEPANDNDRKILVSR